MNSASFLIFISLVTFSVTKDCANRKTTTTKLFCYYSKVTDIDSCYCSHAILPADSDIKAIERSREAVNGVKILVTVNEFNEGLVNLLRTSKVDGLEIKLHKIDSKNDIPDFISTVKDKLGSDLYIAVSVPGRADLLAKYYDFKVLSKKTDSFILQTAFLGANKNVTFHPSRLSGLWDMQNTDSMVDLVSGLGAPLSKIVIASPVQAFEFKLQNKSYTAPGSPATEVRSLTRDELCQKMSNGANWTLERDQDQAGPYIFSGDKWIAFDDSMSIDIKAKYSRVRGLAGLALKDVSQDGGSKCGGSLLEAAYNGLSKQARMPRGAVLQTLEREILETPARPLANVQVSPYRISRVIDVEGHVHVIRQDTRTEFSCTRQGYFVHPRSCNRFYRCVKFDQLSDEFSVFEFDCPAGLAFDERVEVCVWPGSLPHASACSGSSEIAPVPRSRFVCPSEAGYYADPENCRWFFACLDHGEEHLSAYEFRCPFGLVFDENRLVCEWPWIVPRCASGAYLGINLPSQIVYGGQASPAYILEQYDGLGSLGTISLGGLQGPLQQPIAKVYSTVGPGYAHNGGAQIALGQADAGLGYGNVVQGGYVHSDGAQIALGQADAGSGYSNVAQGGYAHNGNAQIALGQVDSGLDYTNTAQRGAHNAASYNDVNFVGGNIHGASHLENGVAGQTVLAGTGSSDSIDYHGTGIFGVNTNNALLTAGKSVYATTGSSSGVGYGAAIGSGNYHGQEGFGGNVGQVTGYKDATIGNDVYITGSNVGRGGKIDFGTQGGGGIRQNVVYSTDNSASLHQGGGGTYSISQTFGGKLPYKAVKALENAGLYRATSFANTGSSGSVIYNTDDEANYNQYLNNVGEGFGLKVSPGTVGISKGNFGRYDTSNTVGTFGIKSDTSQGSAYVSGLSSASQQSSALNTGNYKFDNALSSQSINQVHGTTQPVVTGQVSYDTAYVDGNYGIKSSLNKGSVQASGANVGISSGVIANSGYEHSASISTQSINQIHQNSQPVVQGATFVSTGGHNTGTIDIVGRGYSAVGSSGVEVTNNGAHILSVTPSPVTVTTLAPVPTVTTVPVPVTGTSSSFGVYQGGVIANAPELQFKVTTPSVVYNTGFGARNNYDYVNVSQVHFHEEPVTVVTQKPVIVQPTVSTVTVQGGSGYSYPKPSVAFEEGSAVTVKPVTYSTVRPTVVIEQKYTPVTFVTPKVTVQPVTQAPVTITSYNYQKEDNSQGYHYEKSSTVFEERPQVNAKTSFIRNFYRVPTVNVKHNIYEQPRIISSTPAPFTPKLQEPASFSFSQSSIKSTSDEGYVYEKPSIAFEEEPIELAKTYLPQSPVVRVPSYSYQKTVEIQKSASPFVEHAFVQQPAVSVIQQPVPVQTFTYQRPKSVIYQSQPILPLVQQKPYMFSSYSYQAPTQTTHIQPAQTFYQSFTPTTVQKEKGFLYSYQTPAHATYVQPAIQKFISEKPMIELAQKYPAVFSSYTHQQPIHTTYIQQPIQRTVVQPAVSTYSYQNVLQSAVSNEGYFYPKPAIKFEEEPIISTTAKPVASTQPQFIQTYNYITPSVKPVVVEQQRPAVPVQPQIIQTYNFVNPTVEPDVVEYKKPTVVSTTQTPIVVEKQTDFAGYDYPKPSITFNEEPAIVTTYENRQPVQEIPFIKKKAYVTGKANYQTSQGFGQKINSWYRLDKPQTVSRPVVVQSYQRPAQVYVSSTTPSYKTFEVDTANHNRQSSNYYYTQNNQNLFDQNVVYSTSKPATIYEQTPVSFVTPKPTYFSTIASVVKPKLNAEGRQFYYFDNRLQSTPKAVVQTHSTPLPALETVTTSRPIVRYSFSSLGDKYQYTTPTPLVVSTTPEYVAPVEVTTPIRTYIPQRKVKVTTPVTVTENYFEVSSPKSTYLPVKSSTYLPPPKLTYLPVKSTTYLPPTVSVTTSIPTVKTQKIVEQYVPPEPPREYLPVIPPQKYLPVTPSPSIEYLPVKEEVRVTTATPIVKTQKVLEDYIAPSLKVEPTREYLPVPPPSKEYLPLATPTQEYLPVAPTREYLPVRPVKIQAPLKTIVKVNDFHPLLSAKLGAQCTCTSNTLRLNKRPKQTYTERFVDNEAVQVDSIENLDQEVTYDQSGQTVLENYQYEPQKIVDITPTPIIIKDQVYPIDTSSRVYKVRQRVKVRPVPSGINAVTDATEIFTKNQSPAVEIIESDDEDKPSDREIVKAVRTGLKLVKQAAKEGAKEGTQEVLEGRGGARSRLKAEIDCQRPGLFRHPTQCNKFYSCRWDCTKNRYTLHVFNCPVHLTFDSSLGACNWPSQGPACLENTLLPSD